MNSSNWVSSSSRFSRKETTRTKVVQTSIANGKKTVVTSTTTYTDDPQSILFQELQLFGKCNIREQNELQPRPEIRAPVNQAMTEPEPCNLNQFEKEFLDEHNRYRALHGCPPLKMNRNMCAYSTQWAKNLASRNTLQHRSDRKYGENIFMASGNVVDGRMVVKSWYDEIGKYSYSRPAFSSETGHFTQVVWKSSKELGVGVESRGGTTWVVANYDPPGNMMNEFAQNVPKK